MSRGTRRAVDGGRIIGCGSKLLRPPLPSFFDRRQEHSDREQNRTLENGYKRHRCSTSSRGTAGEPAAALDRGGPGSLAERSAVQRDLTLIRCMPKGICAWDFFLDGEDHHASLEFNWIGEQGAITADNIPFEVRKHGMLSGHWTTTKIWLFRHRKPVLSLELLRFRMSTDLCYCTRSPCSGAAFASSVLER